MLGSNLRSLTRPAGRQVAARLLLVAGLLAASAAYGALSAAPMLLWTPQGTGLAATADRVLAWHPIGLAHIKEALYTYSLWFLPARAPGPIRYPAALLAAAALIFLAGRWMRSRRAGPRAAVRLALAETPRLVLVLALFVVAYVLFLVASISLFDYHTPLDERILLPAYVALVIIGCCLLPPLAAVRTRAARLLLIAVLVAFGLSYLLRGASWVVGSHSEGQEFSSRIWRTSATMQYVSTLPADVPIISNGADAIYAVTGRFAYWVPAKFDPSTRQPNAAYGSDAGAMRELLGSRGARLVVFSGLSWRTYGSTPEDLASFVPLRLVATTEDGAIYQAGE